MKEQKTLAARMIADRLAEINAELDRELAAAAPDWDRVEQLSAEAAACLVSEDQTTENRKALIAVLPAAVPAKRQIQPMRWFRYAAAAAIAGVALFAVPAAIRHNHSIRREPVVTESITTETTAVTSGTELTTSVSVTERTTGSVSSETKTTASVSETQQTASSEAVAETTGTVSGCRQESRVTVSSSTAASSVTTASTQQTGTVTISTASSGSESVPEELTVEYTVDFTETVPSSSSTTTTTGKWRSGRSNSARGTASSHPVTIYLDILAEQSGSLQSAEPVIGAVLELYSMDGTCISRWTSDGTAKELTLDTSQIYRLHAVSVPDDYIMPLRDSVFVPDVKEPQSTVYLRRINAGEEALS